jgi:hypothetical protein
MRSTIPWRSEAGENVAADVRVDWTAVPGAPWLVADVEVAYPATVKRDLLHTPQQKLRRYLDLGWSEVAPFELHPLLSAPNTRPLEVWRRNYLNVVSGFPLDTGAINAANSELDAFNHQVTADFVAVEDGQRGLLLAQSADARTSHAFAPMRLRERNGWQRIAINPFGSYTGRQLDYSQLSATGIGTEFTTLGSSSLRPNGPSYNGERERFRLLVAPYVGAKPPPQLQADAAVFFHPPAVIVSAPGEPNRNVRDLEELAADLRREAALASKAPLEGPSALLASPTDEAVHVAWDPPRDERLTGYELRWRYVEPDADWSVIRVQRTRRYALEALANERGVEIQVRAVGESSFGAVFSAWSARLHATPAPVPPVDLKSTAADAPLWLLLRTFFYGVVHALTT